MGKGASSGGRVLGGSASDLERAAVTRWLSDREKNAARTEARWNKLSAEDKREYARLRRFAEIDHETAESLSKLPGDVRLQETLYRARASEYLRQSDALLGLRTTAGRMDSEAQYLYEAFYRSHGFSREVILRFERSARGYGTAKTSADRARYLDDMYFTLVYRMP